MAVAVGLPERPGTAVQLRRRASGGPGAGIVPKNHLAEGQEYYEARWFTAGPVSPERLPFPAGHAPFGPGLLFDMGPFTFAGGDLQDLWAPSPPAAAMPCRGEVILNLSASNPLVGKAGNRHQLLCSKAGGCTRAMLCLLGLWGKHLGFVFLRLHRCIRKTARL